MPMSEGWVSQGVFDQVKWERDTAIAQLNEIGAGLGEKMDNYQQIVHSKWIDMGDFWQCGNCHNTSMKHFLSRYGRTLAISPGHFCHNCGAMMADIEKVPVCNICGKELNEWDLQENFGFDYNVGYGSKYDGEKIRMRFCCDCFDEIIDKLIQESKVNPIVGTYD